MTERENSFAGYGTQILPVVRGVPDEHQGLPCAARFTERIYVVDAFYANGRIDKSSNTTDRRLFEINYYQRAMT